jgi:NDP-hexose 4-ketoreductase
MRLLIIGASSYLGGHLRRAAADAGVTVLTAGRSPLPGPALALSGSSGGHVRLDLVADSPARVGQVVAAAAPDAVINCAGATNGTAEALTAANVTAVQRLLAALLRLPSPPRLVHIGSAAEYGPGTPRVPVAETDAARPAGLYGATKLAGTRLVELGAAAGLDAVSLRVFNVVGADAPAGTLPGAVAAQLRRLPDGGRGELRLGPLDGVRDFVDARDVADAVLAAAGAAALPHQVVNVASGTGVPSRTLVGQLVAVSGRRVTIREDAVGSARSPALSWQQADITRAAADLGWAPRRDLADAVRDVWEGSCLV